MLEAVPDVSQARVLSFVASERCSWLLVVISAILKGEEGRLVSTIPEGLSAEFVD